MTNPGILRRSLTRLFVAWSVLLSAVVVPLDAEAQVLMCCYYERKTLTYIVDGQIVRIDVTYRLIGCEAGDCPNS